MNDYFPRMKLQPNPNCDERNCLKRQSEYQEKIANQVDVEEKPPKEPEAAVVHEDNVYGMYKWCKPSAADPKFQT